MTTISLPSYEARVEIITEQGRYRPNTGDVAYYETKILHITPIFPEGVVEEQPDDEEYIEQALREKGLEEPIDWWNTLECECGSGPYTESLKRADELFSQDWEEVLFCLTEEDIKKIKSLHGVEVFQTEWRGWRRK